MTHKPPSPKKMGQHFRQFPLKFPLSLARKEKKSKLYSRLILLFISFWLIYPVQVNAISAHVIDLLSTRVINITS